MAGRGAALTSPSLTTPQVAHARTCEGRDFEDHVHGGAHVVEVVRAVIVPHTAELLAQLAGAQADDGALLEDTCGRLRHGTARSKKKQGTALHNMA